MKKSTYTAQTLLLTLTWLLGSCGVDKEKHKAQVNKADRLREQLAKKERSCAKIAEQLTEKSSAALILSTELDAMKNKVMKSALETKTLKSEFAKALKASKDEVETLAKARLEAEKRLGLLKDLTGKLQKQIDAGNLSVRVQGGRMVLKLKSKVLFRSGKADLHKRGKAALENIAKALKGIKDSHFQVAGHTDNKPIKAGLFKDNWQLSTARALAVLMFLQEQGVPGKSLSAAGFGEFQPVARNRSSWGRTVNRRIEITLLPSIPRQMLKKPSRKGRRRK